MAISDVTTAATAAAAAIDAGDWAAAETQVLKAITLLAVIPNSEMGGLSKVEYRGELQGLLAEVRKNRTAAAVGTAGGVRSQKTKYKRATADDEC